MRVGPPPTPDQIRAEFEDSLRGLSLQGHLLPSCVPFNDAVIDALDRIAAAYPNTQATQIAVARAALERQLAAP